MNHESDFYEDREQSEVKHFILENYLRGMAYKIGQSTKREKNKICFVDAFSGPWNNRDQENFSDTSFIRAIEVFDAVKENISKKRDFEVLMAFCEKDPNSYRLLSKALENRQGIKLFNGEFEDKIDYISDFFSDGFIFTFIDPTGFKLRTKEISSFIRRSRGEFLWNYMADHVNRFTSFDLVQDAFGMMLADDSWRDRFDQLSDEVDGNEERVLQLLRERLIELNCATYILEFPVIRPSEKRVQFRLLFGTRHRAGIKVFRDVEKKAEHFQFQKHEEKRRKKSGPLLLSVDDDAKAILGVSGIDGSKAKENAEQMVHTALSKWEGSAHFRDLMPAVLEKARVTESGLKDVLNNMRSNKLIQFELTGRARKPSDETIIRLT